MCSVGHSPGVQDARLPAALSPGNAPQYSGSCAAGVVFMLSTLRDRSRALGEAGRLACRARSGSQYWPPADMQVPSVEVAFGVGEAVSWLPVAYGSMVSVEFGAAELPPNPGST